MMPDWACPQLKRRLEQGCEGGDVTAVQRALYVALRERGSKGTNAKNGAYGPKTIKDVKAFQTMVGINPSGVVGLNTLTRLWDHSGKNPGGAFDDYGVQLFFRSKIGKPTKLDENEIQKGKKGPHVQALQRMLWRALGADSENTRSGEYGKGTVADMRRFYNRANWQDRNPEKCTNQDWVALWAFGDDRAKELARKVIATPDDVIRQKIRSWGEWYVQNRSRITYAQIRPYPKTGKLPMRTDCSGSSTHVLFMAGCKNDPHRRGYDGQGYTGTMYTNGKRIGLSNLKDLRPGDCVFYGNQGGGIPSHVVIVIGPGDRALNFGSNPPHFVNIGTYWRSNLRTDVGARRYF
jgi:cell wall-associated NlpC family hydrolase